MTTTAKVDDKLRVRIPGAKPGQMVTVQSNREGWTLSLIKESPDESSIADMIKNLKPFTKEEARLAYQVPDPEFDALEHHCASLPVAPPEED